jgi:hypothetical protein
MKSILLLTELQLLKYGEGAIEFCNNPFGYTRSFLRIVNCNEIIILSTL